MRLRIGAAILFATVTVLLGCTASSQLGLDPATGTVASQKRLYGNEMGYEVICDNGMRFCLQRAEAICQGPYRIVDWPSQAPRVQALINFQIVTVNTSSPSLIKIVCG